MALNTFIDPENNLLGASLLDEEEDDLFTSGTSLISDAKEKEPSQETFTDIIPQAQSPLPETKEEPSIVKKPLVEFKVEKEISKKSDEANEPTKISQETIEKPQIQRRRRSVLPTNNPPEAKPVVTAIPRRKPEAKAPPKRKDSSLSVFSVEKPVVEEVIIEEAPAPKPIPKIGRRRGVAPVQKQIEMSEEDKKAVQDRAIAKAIPKAELPPLVISIGSIKSEEIQVTHNKSLQELLLEDKDEDDTFVYKPGGNKNESKRIGRKENYEIIEGDEALARVSERKDVYEQEGDHVFSPVLPNDVHHYTIQNHFVKYVLIGLLVFVVAAAIAYAVILSMFGEVSLTL